VGEYAPGFKGDPGDLEDVKKFLIYYFLSSRRYRYWYGRTQSWPESEIFGQIRRLISEFADHHPEPDLTS
jgi:hypothetical protein